MISLSVTGVCGIVVTSMLIHGIRKVGEQFGKITLIFSNIQYTCPPKTLGWENTIRLAGKTWTPWTMDGGHHNWAYLAPCPNYRLLLVSCQSKPSRGLVLVSCNHSWIFKPSHSWSPRPRRIYSALLPASHCALFQVCSLRSQQFFMTFNRVAFILYGYI